MGIVVPIGWLGSPCGGMTKFVNLGQELTVFSSVTYPPSKREALCASVLCVL